jgi:molybdopterin synthase sulfur carrier subunit
MDMSITVRLPGVLRAEAGGNPVLEQEVMGEMTLGAVLDRIGANWPLLDRRIRDERGELRRYVNVYVDGEECRRMDGLQTPVSDRAEILVVPSVAGG